MKLISVILSFRNEEDNIRELTRRISDVFSTLPFDYEMIFVNDCSTDKSLEILTELSSDNARIKVINMSRRCGPAPCVLAGFAHSRGAAVICLDSDLQDPPELIPKLIEEWVNGADVVHTTRLSRAGESRIKLLITHIAYRAIRLVSDTDIPVDSGDYKLISRRAVLELLKLKEDDPFLRGLVCWVGFKQTRILYHREPRMAGRTSFPLLSSGPVRTFISGITSFSSYPLYCSLILGFVISVFSFVYLVGILFTTIILGMNNPGWPSIMATLLFLGGVTLLSNGVTGIYVGRIHRQVKHRPLWIVESYVNITQGERISDDRTTNNYERGFYDAIELSARTAEEFLDAKEHAAEAIAKCIRSVTPMDHAKLASDYSQAQSHPVAGSN